MFFWLSVATSPVLSPSRCVASKSPWSSTVTSQVGHAVRLLRTVEVDEVDLRLAVAVVPERHVPR